ncbi:MAG: hypothetical protein NVS3B21_33310 [Acidimicrobiales bacterium]
MAVANVSDVVIVGGGIAGASLAYALAGAGLGVTVLESAVDYKDRVRGECLVPWGVREARNLGVEEVLLNAGAHICGTWKQYSEDEPEPSQTPMSAMVPGVSGSLNLSHPRACQALIDAAAAQGARVVRGVRNVKVSSGSGVRIAYTSDSAHELTSQLVVGADGRRSEIRQQAGITLQRQEPVNYIAGLLVDGLDTVPADHDAIAREGDATMLVFHQGAGRARVYLVVGESGRHRFVGPEGGTRFLEACAVSCLPWAADLVAGRQAGPCATYPGDDTWTATPYADGVVLIGDAAGHNDPIIGQGLSIAMRDARVVRDLILDGARQADDFTAYGHERSARMERLRLIADVFSAQSEDAPNRRARRAFIRQKLRDMDQQFFPLIRGAFAGPETVPDDLVRPELIDQIRVA